MSRRHLHPQTEGVPSTGGEMTVVAVLAGRSEEIHATSRLIRARKSAALTDSTNLVPSMAGVGWPASGRNLQCLNVPQCSR